MQTIAQIIIIVVAIEHLLFMGLEMFMWTQPSGRRIFGTSAEQAKTCQLLAANQGLYNGFLAAGLIWGLSYADTLAAQHIQSFFLVCVVIAGVYGGLTVSRRIVFIQAGPALCALALLWLH